MTLPDFCLGLCGQRIGRCAAGFGEVAPTAATRGGTRDFASFTQIVATKYEVLVAHNQIARARELVTTMPPV